MIPSFLFPAFVSLPVTSCDIILLIFPKQDYLFIQLVNSGAFGCVWASIWGSHTPSLDYHPWPEFSSLSVERTDREAMTDTSDPSMHGSTLLPTFANLLWIPITCRTEPPILNMVLSTCYSPLSLLPSLILCQSLSSTQQPRLGKANATGMVVLTHSSSLRVTNGSLIMRIFSSLPRILLSKGIVYDWQYLP